METDDLSTPLGKRAKKKGLAVPAFVPQAVAGVLGLCLAVFVGWILVADDPYGGEPMAIANADVPASPDAKGGAQAAAPTSAKPDGAAAAPATGAETAKSGASTNAQTVTIIDGSTGKRQEVQVGGPGGVPAIAPTSTPAGVKAEPKPGVADPRLIDTSRHGVIPKIGSDGARPSDVYARPVKPQASRPDIPKVAIVVAGLGVGASTTAEALAKLPAAVTLAFVPYGSDVERWVSRARSESREVLLQVGMEPFDYPDNDPGPQTLLTAAPPEKNIEKLHWFMSRFQGYVGITSLMGARFTATDQAFTPVLRDAGKRGLIYFDDGSSARSLAGQIAGGNNVTFAKADVVLDSVPTGTEIDAALTKLEGAARERGVAIGSASALPVTIDRIAQWAKAAEARGIMLVPVTAVANKPKSS